MINPVHSETSSVEQLAGQPINRRLRIAGYAPSAGSRQRLLEMGLTIGMECTVVRYAPLGDPMEVKVRGYRLLMRLSEAEGIQVQPIA